MKKHCSSVSACATFTLLLVLASTPSILAQDSLRYRSLWTNFGVSNVQSKEQSSNTYKGLNYNVAIGYNVVTPRNRHEIAFSLTTGSLKSTGFPKANNQLAVLTYDYYFLTRSLKENMSFALGAGIHGLVTNIDYSPEAVDSKPQLDVNAYLTLSGQVRYKISPRSTIAFTAGVSTIGVSSQTMNNDRTNEFTHLGNSLMFNAKLEYTYRLTNKTSIFISYRNDYLTTHSPQTSVLSQHILGAGITSRLGRK